MAEGPTPEAFQDPPVETRPHAYWNWLNGNVDLEQLTRDLEEMKDKGMGGADMWDTGALRNPDNFIPAGPPFLEEESVKAIHHALAEGKRLGLELGLVTSSGWNAGGPWVTPEMASKNAYVSTLVVEGPRSVEEQLPFPELPEHCPRDANGLPQWYHDIAVLAVPDNEQKLISSRDQILNLSNKFNDGTLRWEAPAGRWVVLRFACTDNGQQLIAPSPNSTGPFIDFLEPAATRMHFQYILDKIGVTPENARELGLSSFEVDSMELEPGIQWTEKFPQYFQNWQHYDIMPWLPALAGWTIENTDTTQQFLYDYKKTISNQLILSHYVTGSELLAKYGMHLIGEAGGPGPPIWDTCPVDALKALGAVGVPRGEFWIRHRNMFLIKEISSASHIYGKKLVDAESFTTWRRWKDSPYAMKFLVDRAFCEGLNRITYHGFAHSPEEADLPGRTYHAGSDMNPRVTWWSKARPFMDYMARCCYMLQQGLSVTDVCYYYGDQAPNFFPEFHDVPEKPRLPGLGNGYDFDIVNSDVILNRMEVREGRLFLPDGTNYALLILRDQDHMPLEVLQKIAALIEQGATVLGPKPHRVPGLLQNAEKTAHLQALAARVWGSCDGQTVKENKFGAGRVVWGMTPEEVLRSASIAPDFSYTA
ncbi:MAG: hypothetical protein HYZ00_01525, partial [Candidatus Hydrogenedentes bacterium]|nr:hypothetical protein [Candidatus Hydrogenedentota bacterium]